MEKKQVAQKNELKNLIEKLNEITWQNYNSEQQLREKIEEVFGDLAPIFDGYEDKSLSGYFLKNNVIAKFGDMVITTTNIEGEYIFMYLEEKDEDSYCGYPYQDPWDYIKFEDLNRNTLIYIAKNLKKWIQEKIEQEREIKKELKEVLETYFK